MKTRKKKSFDVLIEPINYSWLNALFNPTVGMAADFMNVSEDVVRVWLAQEHYAPVADDRLTDSAIDFLASKYVDRLHKYFDNCSASWDSLDTNEQSLFSQFINKYGKYNSFWVEAWQDIDSNIIAQDFKDNLAREANDALFGCFDPFECPDVIIASRRPLNYTLSDYIRDTNEARDNYGLLFLVSHSIYYGSRTKTRIPSRPNNRNVVFEILKENHFYIFSGESDSNVLIETQLSSIVRPLQLAIASVLGYLKHNHDRRHEHNYQIQTYYSS